jgi:hypothetical protein
MKKELKIRQSLNMKEIMDELVKLVKIYENEKHRDLIKDEVIDSLEKIVDTLKVLRTRGHKKIDDACKKYDKTFTKMEKFDEDFKNLISKQSQKEQQP